MLKLFPLIRARLQGLLHLSDMHSMLLWAGLIGMLGALTTIIFRTCLSNLQWLLTGHSGSLVSIAKSLSWPMRMLLPAAGGVAAGCVLLTTQRVQTSASADYMEAISVGSGQLSIRQTLLRSLSSLLTIASGGSIGREGSMVQLAAMSASVVDRTRNLAPYRLRLLVACGAAAGISSAYNAPIAGAFFVTEIVLGSIVMESFGPIVVASVVANIVMRKFSQYQPPYEMPAFPETSNLEVFLFVGLGILAGLVAPQFLRLLALVKDQLQKSGLPLPLRLGVCGLLVGIISIWVPQVWGNGYSVVNSLLHEHWLWSAVMLVFFCKLAATALTVGSGAIGGIITPTLFMGAAIGWLFGYALQLIWPGAVSAPFTYAMVGMGAFLAAATGAPLMAIMMIFEMTLSYQIMLPLLLASIVAYFVARSKDGISMYAITDRRYLNEKARLRLRQIHMRDLIKPAETVLPLDAPLSDIMRVFLQYPVKYLYIVDDRQHLSGVVALQDLMLVLAEHGEHASKIAADLVRQDAIKSITPDMSLDEGWQHFMAHQGERLPVIDSRDNPVLLGIVNKSAILDAYFQLGAGIK